MFTAYIQLIDLITLGQPGLFLMFFTTSWIIHIIKLTKMVTRDPLQLIDQRKYSPKVSIIIPVVDEPLTVWHSVLFYVNIAVSKYDGECQKIVVANGHNGHEVVELAKKMGFEVVRIGPASKRKAIAEGMKLVKRTRVTIILDSDTIIYDIKAISKMTQVFRDKTVGGVTPKHIITGRNDNLMRRISDWLEDIRFDEVVRAQSSFGEVSCLPGRLLAVKTGLLRKIIPGLVKEKFLGASCISGDDRYITSEILKRGYKAVYVEDCIVKTEAPDTLKGFMMQRLRWSRTSFRETLRSLSWTFKHPYMSFTVLSTIFMRWFFLAVVINAFLNWFEFIQTPHYLNLGTPTVVTFTILGFLLSGLVKQARHLIKYPGDFKYLPIFLFVTTFILTPIEWFGNLTIRESGWMTRKVTK